MAGDVLHDRLLKIALTLPEAVEDWPWGSVHCKVRGKIFAGWGREHDGVMALGVRTSMDRQAVLVAADPAISIAKYVGKYGGIDIRLEERPDWDEVEDFIVESYRIIAPKRLSRALDAAKDLPPPRRSRSSGG
jgi:phosphoribosylglycinamide formyltransferase 1